MLGTMVLRAYQQCGAWIFYLQRQQCKYLNASFVVTFTTVSEYTKIYYMQTFKRNGVSNTYTFIRGGTYILEHYHIHIFTFSHFNNTHSGILEFEQRYRSISAAWKRNMGKYDDAKSY